MTTEDAISNLITTYQELNPSIADELHDLPSPLEFMRYVSKNRPFTVRGCITDWEACQRWDAAYLKQLMAGSKVRVAVTPEGYAIMPFAA